MQYHISFFHTFSHLRNLKQCVHRGVTTPQVQQRVWSDQQSFKALFNGDSAWVGDQIWIARISRSAELPSLCNVVSSIYQLFVPHFRHGRIYVYLFNNE